VGIYQWIDAGSGTGILLVRDARAAQFTLTAD
jgi:hypothetical protein